jgi:hypothetical protein
MALETLKDVKEIDGFQVDSDCYMVDVEQYLDERTPIAIYHKYNVISFKIQNGPIEEVGVNGCQVDTLIAAAKLIIEGLNDKYTCKQNDQAILALNHALFCLHERKIDRERRGVEGENKA